MGLLSWWAERVVRPHLRVLRTINTLQALTLIHLCHTQSWCSWIWWHLLWPNLLSSCPLGWLGLLTLVNFPLWLCWVTWSLHSFVKREASTWRDRLGPWQVEVALTSSCSCYPWSPDTSGQWMIINDIISYQMLSMSEVIDRIWRLCCIPMENKLHKNNKM